MLTKTYSQQLREEWESKRITGEWKIASKSEAGKFHLVQLFRDGQMQCDCYAGGFKRECRHKQEVRSYFF